VVEVDASPKFHCQEVGVPVEVSVNCTACPTTGEAGPYMKEAVSEEAGNTLSVWLTLLEPELLATVRVTVYNATVAKVWPGFWAELVAPSPKLHCQEVGVPVEVSVNCTACPVTGEAGVKVKDAVSGEG
jgi:hypothetical protein